MGNASPSENISFLMREPMTLFDWGIYRLREELKSVYYHRAAQKAEGKDEVNSVLVDYVWALNRIRIAVTGHRKQPLSRPELERECASVLNSIRSILNIDPKTGKPRGKFEHSALSEYFSHEGFAAAGTPADLSAELDKITYINAGVIIPGTIFLCEGALLDSKVLFSRG